MDTKDDNKDVHMLKEELWLKKQMITEITILQRSLVVEKTTLMKNIIAQSMLKEEYISLTTTRFENKFYRNITILQILDIQDNKE